MSQRTDQLTLDTNVVWELWDQQDKYPVVEALLDLSDRGLVDLAVTATIHQDIPSDPLAQRISQLPELGIDKIGTVARWGNGVYGRDLYGDQTYVDWHESLGRSNPDQRDFDHVHAHMLSGRDFFLTWDNPILNLAKEFSDRWDIEVRRPEDYIESRSDE